MAGRGAAPKAQDERVNRVGPSRGEWTAAPATGWQHGDVPEAPDGLMPASIEAWTTWFAAWFAAHWSPDDVPALRLLIGLYDQVERGKFERHNELRLAMDTYGITPKGQQDRRWTRVAEPGLAPAATKTASKKQAGRRGAALKVLTGGVAS